MGDGRREIGAGGSEVNGGGGAAAPAMALAAMTATALGQTIPVRTCAAPVTRRIGLTAARAVQGLGRPPWGQDRPAGPGSRAGGGAGAVPYVGRARVASGAARALAGSPQRDESVRTSSYPNAAARGRPVWTWVVRVSGDVSPEWGYEGGETTEVDRDGGIGVFNFGRCFRAIPGGRSRRS